MQRLDKKIGSCAGAAYLLKKNIQISRMVEKFIKVKIRVKAFMLSMYSKLFFLILRYLLYAKISTIEAKVRF